jgi:hypothetical protein
MNAKELLVLLRAMGACREAVYWVKGKSFAEAWRECERADWMLWLCGRMIGKAGWPTREQIVLVLCDLAETALPFYEKKCPNDLRPRKSIEVTRAWAEGKATIEQVREARAAAYAYAAAYAADTAAYADAAAYAYAAYAYAAAADAAAAAADAAAAAAAADAAAADAAWRQKRLEVLKEFANKVRERLKVPE